MHTVYHVSSDNLLVLLRTSRENGCCLDQQSFHQLLKVVGKNGLAWRAIKRKEQLGGTKRLKKLFEQRKMRSKRCCSTDRHLICNSTTLNTGADRNKKGGGLHFFVMIQAYANRKVFTQIVTNCKGLAITSRSSAVVFEAAT